MCVRSSYSQGWQKILFLLSIPILGTCSAAFGQGTGYWHTSGNQIVDASGRSIRIAGINWYGFETTDQVVLGLWVQDYHTIIKAIKNNGYNTIRLPYSNQMVETPIVPKNLSFSNGGGAINTDLKGLNALQAMDKIISAAGDVGLRVILDNHRSEAGNSAEANGLWHTSAYPESAWINDWKTLVSRYADYKDASGNPTVVAVDLRNEPHVIANGSHTGACRTGDASTGGCPTTNSAQNWPAAAQRSGNAVLSANSNLLIIVEGVDCYSGDCDWWGGNLEGVSRYPITLNVSNRLVYDYGPNLYQQSWFSSSTSFSSLSSVWNKFWGYINVNHIAPVLIGEFGTGNNASGIQSATPGSQGQWFESLVNFLQNNPSLNWTYWALNGEDSYALLDSQYDSTPASSLKQSELTSIQSALSGGGSGSGTCSVVPSAPSGLAAAAVFQPNQSELDCGHSAGQLQHHVQRVPQHDQRIHSILKQSNRERIDHSVPHEYWALSGDNLPLQSGSGRCRWLVAGLEPGERHHPIQFRRIRLPRGLRQRQPMEHRVPGGHHHTKHWYRGHHKLDAQVDVPWQSANHESMEWKLCAERSGSDNQERRL